MLTARTTESDMLDNLRLGADDCVTKPFGPVDVHIVHLLRNSDGSSAQLPKIVTVFPAGYRRSGEVP